MEPVPDLRSAFLLDPDVIYLNHGSFGACPRPVFEAYQAWQRRLELEPVQFLGVNAARLLKTARQALAQYVGCNRDELVFFSNPTTAVNMIARSLHLQPGDEILTTNHEYGAMDRTWRFVCQMAGATIVRQPILLPLQSPEDVVDQLWSGLSDRTRAVFLSHITSQTALTFPVADVCALARDAGVLSIIDGAHAPGQIPLNLSDVGADFYTGACHKWLGAPKGSAFLFARGEAQALTEPLVVSWGWEAEKPSESTFIDHHEWQGTRDLAAFLSVPAAIEFQTNNHWPVVQSACHELAVTWRALLNRAFGEDPICGDEMLHQMFSVRIPVSDPEVYQSRLFSEHHIELPVFRWNGDSWIRVSVQAYNQPSDIDALMDALDVLR